MSVQDDVLVTDTDSFWELDGYKATVRRTDDGLQMCGELMKLIQERADIEKDYAKKLKSWSKKWTESIDKGTEYGTNKSTLKGALNEAERLADVHLEMRDRLIGEVLPEVKEWRNDNYKKHMVGGCREARGFEDEFKKAQKPWSKKLSKMTKCRKDYHAACKLLKNNQSQESTIKNTEAPAEQVRKQQEKFERYRRDAEDTKQRYDDSLAELNSYTSTYIEDMTEVYNKTQAFELLRLQFFKQILYRLQSCLDISNNSTIPQIYQDFHQTIDQADPALDLKWWSQFRGIDMPMAWPTFEEYSLDGQSTPRKERTVKDVVTVAAVSNGTLVVPGSNNKSNLPNSDQGEDAGGENPFGADSDEWEDCYNSTSGAAHDDVNDVKGVNVRALYKYVGQESDELTFNAGDVFEKLRDRDDQGWCTGRKDGRVGLYPDSYAQPI